MIDTQMLGDQGMLCSHVVIKRDSRKRLDVGVGGGGRLPISEQSGNDDEVFLGVQSFVVSYEPFIVGNGFGISISQITRNARMTYIQNTRKGR